jgi:predicted O-methyltransferase YrrM
MSEEIIHPNWFVETDVISIFEENLAEYAGKKLDFLQIGVFTGDASLWLIENILTHPESTLTDVDIWEGDAGLDGFNWDTAYVAYKKKMANYLDKVTPIQITSDDFFKRNNKTYDIIYIDGDHVASAVLRDAIHAFDCLNDGGLLIFDDYEFGYHAIPSRFAPKDAIDAFLKIHWFDIEKVYEGRQIWVKKVDRLGTNKIYNWKAPEREDAKVHPSLVDDSLS